MILPTPAAPFQRIKAVGNIVIDELNANTLVLQGMLSRIPVTSVAGEMRNLF